MGNLRAFNLRDKIKPRDIQDLTSDAVRTVIETASSTGAHTLSGAAHTGLLGSTQATQFAFNEGNGADDASDRSAYNANRMTGAKAHIVPLTTDTYDIGTSTKWFRSQYVSQINAAVFAEQVIQLFGGWAYIAKYQGNLNAAVASGDSTIDLGVDLNTIFPGITYPRFIKIASHDTAGAIKTEYISLTGAPTGTVYPCTRDLAAAHVTDPAWAAGTPYAYLGSTGDGRIELNAYDTPRIQLITQGATYNAQTEVLRIGDLNTGWGYVAETYGLAIGEYAASKPNITIDSTNGLRIRNYSTDVLVLDTSGNADLSGKLRMLGASSAIAIGTTPPTSASAGTGIWLDRTGMYGLASDVQQAIFDAATGAITAGGGVLTIDSDGITVSVGALSDPRKFKFKSGSTIWASWATVDAAGRTDSTILVPSITGRNSLFEVYASSPTLQDSGIRLRSTSASTYVELYLQADDDGITQAQLTGALTISTTLAVTGNTTLTGTLAVNGASITTDDTTFALLNTTATTVNAFGAATTVNLGAASLVVNGAGGMTINGGVAANDDLTLQGTSNATRTTSYVLLQPNGGNVGIGTTGPTASDWDANMRVLHLYQNSTSGAGLKVESSTARGYVIAGDNQMIVGTNTDDPLYLVVNGSAQIGVNSSAEVGINSAPAANVKLYAKGAGASSTTYGYVHVDSASANAFWTRDDGAGYLKAAAWTYGSDIRMKENVRPIDADALSYIRRLEPVAFDYIGGPKREAGFVAQHMRGVLPDLVVEVDKDGTLGMKTTELIPYLVRGEQQLDARLATLEAENVALKAQIEALQRRFGPN